MKPKHVILGIHILNRVKDVGAVQSHLTDFGAWIHTRLGLHRVDVEGCSKGGVILLDMTDEGKCDALAAKLDALEGIETRKMVFTHDA